MIDFPQLTKNLRVDILKMIYVAEFGYLADSLAVVDFLTLLFFGQYLNYDPTNPRDPRRDYFILDYKNIFPAVCTIWGEAGFFPKEEYWRFGQIDGLLQTYGGIGIPGMEVVAGTGGQGLAYAVGLAAGLKKSRFKNKVFCVAEPDLQSFPIFSASLAQAGKEQLNNLVLILPNSQDSRIFLASNWEFRPIDDGHNFELLGSEFERLKKDQNQPVCLGIKTIPGKGIDFMEQNDVWKNKIPSQSEFEKALNLLT